MQKKESWGLWEVLEKKGSEFWARLQYNLIGLFVQRELCEDLVRLVIGWSYFLQLQAVLRTRGCPGGAAEAVPWHAIGEEVAGWLSRDVARGHWWLVSERLKWVAMFPEENIGARQDVLHKFKEVILRNLHTIYFN